MMPQKTQTMEATATAQNNNQDANSRFGAYLSQVFESSFYKKGDANIQRSVREKIYEQKMKPFYAKYGMPLPDKEYFVSGNNKNINKSSSYAKDFAKSYFKESAKSAKEDVKGIPSAIEEGVTSFATEVAKTGGKVIGGLDKASSAVSRDYFADSLIDSPSQRETFKKMWDSNTETRNKVADNLTEMGNRGEEWSEDNHINDLKHSVGKYGGMLAENVAEFEAVLNPLKAAGITVGGYKYLAGLTKVLQNSQRGRLGLHILANAATAYSIDKAKGEDNKEALKGAGYTVAGDLLLQGGGKLVKGFYGRVASVGGRPLVEEVINGMDAKQAPPDKVGRALVKTSTDLRDKLAQEMFGKNFKDIPNIADKGKVNKAFAEAAAQAPKSKAAVNKTAVKAQIIKALDTHKKASPEFKALAGALEEANKRPTEDVVTAEQVARKNAKGTVKKEVKLLTTSGKAKIDDLAQSVGAAGAKDPVFLNSLADIARANVPDDIKKLEGHRNKIAFLWSIRQELPPFVVKEVINRMKEFYPQLKSKDWDGVAKNFESHIEDMRASGHVNPNDRRGVFRSTQLAGTPTKWQEQLSIEAEVANLKKQTKRKDVHDMLDSLNKALRRKSPDLEKLGDRLDEIKAKQKELAKKPLKGIDKIRAATPNATGTKAEAAVEKALSKLDTKRTKEQVQILKKFAKDSPKATSNQTVAGGGTSALSSEELARGRNGDKHFYLSPGGKITYQGSQVDAPPHTIASGGAVVKFNPKTGWTVINGDSKLLDKFKLKLKDVEKELGAK
jgi:hypothetical protein